MGGLGKQLQQMQEEMVKAQEELEKETLEVTAGGGAITIVITGHQRIKSINILPEVIDADECARRHQLISTDNLLGGLWDPSDGDIDPAQLCQALARRARKAGAEVYRNTSLKRVCQTDLCRLYEHKHQVLSLEEKNSGLMRMAIDIMTTGMCLISGSALNQVNWRLA